MEIAHTQAAGVASGSEQETTARAQERGGTHLAAASLRIAVDARVLSLPETRGIGGYLMEILREWPASAKDIFTLFSDEEIPQDRLVSLRDRVAGEKEPACTITPRRIRSCRGGRFRVWEWLNVPGALRKGGYDLLWTPANVTLPVRGIRQVTTVHDTILQEFPLATGKLERLFAKRIFPARTRRYAGGVITVSAFSRERIAQVFGYPAERIHVVHNGATFARQPFPSAEGAWAFLVGQGFVNRPYVLVFGAESPWKNTHGALHAFAYAAARCPDLDMVIAGLQPRVLEHFVKMVAAAGLTDRVRLLPFIDASLRDALYQAARIFLYPSLFEGFGLPPLEAMAAGVPVVASDAASIPEVTGQAALLVNAHDAMLTGEALLLAHRDEGLREQLVKAGREHVLRFRWSFAAEEHRKVFERMAL